LVHKNGAVDSHVLLEGWFELPPLDDEPNRMMPALEIDGKAAAIWTMVPGRYTHETLFWFAQSLPGKAIH
jgi:hypothetical protein